MVWEVEGKAVLEGKLFHVSCLLIYLFSEWCYLAKCFLPLCQAEAASGKNYRGQILPVSGVLSQDVWWGSKRLWGRIWPSTDSTKVLNEIKYCHKVLMPKVSSCKIGHI